MLFVDTGPLLAKYIERDQHHEEATGGWAQLERSRERLATSLPILCEYFSLLARHSSARFAAERARNMFDSKVFEILRPESRQELLAVDLFGRYAYDAVSFTDCLSFALMRHHKIKRVFTFDRHFEMAGFSIWRPHR
jgi:predicted nucleic acid-binding protein